ncbi:cytochrome P450 [Diplogelasinospora grovesii]|uniref:Cytochrome P450 n=1 Tax=Diplogelasinospora grovesii TaxID=303347 RepID=A0AAN6S4F1_9PEZI|nr:cytochrome P450 [Diplogelasinospora grovesii]
MAALPAFGGLLPFPTLSFQFLGLLTAILFVGGYLVRRALLPKPIPGVPYRKANAEKLLGNGLEMLAWKKEHGEMFGYLAKMAVELNAPIFQIFVHPFGKPWVVIADNRESNDIMARRTSRDFDRSRFLGDLLSSLSPEFHFHMPTGERWKSHRKLLADTMSPAFLSEVAGPQMWKSTMKAIELWQVKERLAEGRPFSITEDLRKAAYEIIWTATFGFETGAMKVQSDLLSSLPKFENLPHIDQAVDFPAATDPPIFKAGLALNDALQGGIQSLVPRLHLFLAYNAVPSLRAARSLKNRVIEGEIKKAIEKFSTKTDVKWEDQNNLRRYMKSAMDMVIARELQSARKEGRAPEPLSRIIQDELFSFMLAGNEVYTLVVWTLKFLTAHQDVQARLRQELHDQLKQALETGATPTASEIGAAKLPYFDAVMEESLRCGEITQTNIRTTQRDVIILGHHVPKDTEVLMLNNGPGVFLPPLHVDEGLRSETSRGAVDKIGEWDLKGMRDFDPSRWLVEDDQEQISFNPSAGPRHSFGAGPRGCFGRKWAMLEVRIMVVLIIWKFRLEEIPEPLGSFKPKPGLAHRPEMAFVRLTAL